MPFSIIKTLSLLHIHSNDLAHLAGKKGASDRRRELIGASNAGFRAQQRRTTLRRRRYR